jgi:hypothetical protein
MPTHTATIPCPACNGLGQCRTLGLYGQPETEGCSGCNCTGVLTPEGNWVHGAPHRLGWNKVRKVTREAEASRCPLLDAFGTVADAEKWDAGGRAAVAKALGLPLAPEE